MKWAELREVGDERLRVGRQCKYQGGGAEAEGNFNLFLDEVS